MEKITFCLLLIVFGSCILIRPEKNNFKPEMIPIQGGTFNLGDFYESKNTDAIPTHSVTVKDYKIGKYEITYRQFDYFAEQTGFERPKSDILERGERAVTHVNWDEAMAFCKYFGFRLPTEVEWEYAARSRGQDHVLSGATSLDSIYVVALTKHEKRKETIKVGTKKPNGLGIYDMSGNAFEWIGQYYQFYSMPDRKHSLDDDAVRIIRGGSYYENILANRTYWRTGTLRDVRSEDIGFRCADD